MAPKTQKPSKAQKEEPKEEQPAAPAVNVVGALGPNAGKTVQGMSFLSMLKKNAAPEAAAAPKEEEKKPVAVDLPAAAAPAAKSKKAKKETAAAAPVATPAPVEPVEEVQPVVEEPVAVVPVAEAPVEEAPVEEPIVEEAAVVVETASEPPATFNWADAGSDFTQFSSRTEILPAVVAEPVVEKLAPPTPQVTFRSPFTAAHGLLFVAPRLEMLLSNQLEAVRQRESQVALEQKRHEGNVTVDKNFKAQADKELLEARARLAADREALNRERNEFRQQQQQQQQQQPAPQQQHQQHHHHHHHHHHHQQHQHQGFPSHSTRHTEPAPHSWADDDFGYDAPQVQYRGTPAYNRPPMNSQQQQISGRQMSAGYPTMYNNNTPGMPRQTRPAMGPRPGGAFTHHHHHHHHHSHQQQFPSHYGGESQW